MVCCCKLNTNTSYSVSIFYLTSKQINRSISTAAHFCSTHSEKEECGSALSLPSLCDIMIQRELTTLSLVSFSQAAMQEPPDVAATLPSRVFQCIFLLLYSCHKNFTGTILSHGIRALRLFRPGADLLDHIRH